MQQEYLFTIIFFPRKRIISGYKQQVLTVTGQHKENDFLDYNVQYLFAHAYLRGPRWQ